MSRITYSPEDVASFEGVSYWTVLRWIESGKLKARKSIGGHKWIIQREDLEAARVSAKLRDEDRSADLGETSSTSAKLDEESE